jgi:hypothetical protein
MVHVLDSSDLVGTLHLQDYRHFYSDMGDQHRDSLEGVRLSVPEKVSLL